MPTTIKDSNDPLETRVRANLAYMWSCSTIVMIAYIVYVYGSQTEILTLIIGLIGGTILGGIFGFYFAGTTIKKSDTQMPVTGTNPQINVNPQGANFDLTSGNENADSKT